MLLRGFRSPIPPPGVYCHPEFALIPVQALRLGVKQMSSEFMLGGSVVVGSFGRLVDHDEPQVVVVIGAVGGRAL
jgi:hypothetical protein